MSSKWRQEAAGQPLLQLGCERGRGGQRLKVAYCFPILCLHTMIVDLQHRWHILMMDGAAEAGGHPAAIVRSLIK